MVKTKVRIKKWGNSLGIVIPNEIVKEEDLENKEEIEVIIRKKRGLEDFFGRLKRKIDPQKMKDKSREIWG
jgi:antitoxin component of MazEF toxin-antitoxin module